MGLVDQILKDREACPPPAGRPLVTLTYAQSLDGCISLRRSMPLVLSGPESKAMTHTLRANHDGILAGIETVLADDPKLTARLAGGPHPQPVILDSWLRLPASAQLLRQERKPWVITTAQASPARRTALENLGVKIFVAGETTQGRVDLPSALALLHQAGLKTLMVEGGAGVITSFLAQGLADFLVLTIAPLLVGGLHGLQSEPPFPDATIEVSAFQSGRLGKDIIAWGQPVWKGAPSQV